MEMSKCSNDGQLPGEGHEKLLHGNEIREFGINKENTYSWNNIDTYEYSPQQSTSTLPNLHAPSCLF